MPYILTTYFDWSVLKHVINIADDQSDLIRLSLLPAIVVFFKLALLVSLEKRVSIINNYIVHVIETFYTI